VHRRRNWGEWGRLWPTSVQRFAWTVDDPRRTITGKLVLENLAKLQGHSVPANSALAGLIQRMDHVRQIMVTVAHGHQPELDSVALLENSTALDAAEHKRVRRRYVSTHQGRTGGDRRFEHIGIGTAAVQQAALAAAFLGDADGSLEGVPESPAPSGAHIVRQPPSSGCPETELVALDGKRDEGPTR
jgi:hypothetical protein